MKELKHCSDCVFPYHFIADIMVHINRNVCMIEEFLEIIYPHPFIDEYLISLNSI